MRRDDENRQAVEALRLSVFEGIVVVGATSRDVERLFPECACAYSELPLAQAYRRRNRIAHGYATIDLPIVWRTATENLPSIKQEILRLHPSLNDR